MPQTEVGRSEDLFRELRTWVELETPTTDPAAVNQLMDIAERELAAAERRSSGFLAVMVSAIT